MARVTRAERLDRGGIVWAEMDGVLARLTKKSGLDSALARRLIPVVSYAHALAVRMRDRVRNERRTFTGAGLPPMSHRGSVLLSERYASLAGLSERWYRSSAEMHAALGTQLGYSVTGGMWGDLQVASSGLGADVNFGGALSSGRGRSSILRVWGRIYKTVRPQAIKSQTKANAILRAHGHNIVAPSIEEVRSIGLVMMRHEAERAATAIGIQLDTRLAMRDRDLAAAVERQPGSGRV